MGCSWISVYNVYWGRGGCGGTKLIYDNREQYKEVGYSVAIARYMTLYHDWSADTDY